MIFWILAIVLLGSLGVIGFYQGAIRVGFSLIGLLVAALLAVPLGFLVKPIVAMFGVTHPVALTFIAPFVVFVVVLIAFKSAGFAVHRKADTYYKYRDSDTKRLLFERMNSRLGIALGVANATVYVFLLAFVVYTVGYFTKQVQTANQTGSMQWANLAADHLRDSRMDKAVASFMPKDPLYYDSVDVIGYVFHQPLLQSRLGTYPPFLSLEDNAQIKAVAADQRFQGQWLGGMSFNEWIGDPNISAVMHDADLYKNVLGMLGNDLGDLKTHLLTGTSPKFENEPILGRWTYDPAASFTQTKRKKPNMSIAETRLLRRALALLNKGVFTAYVDNKAKLAIPAAEASQQGMLLAGTWRAEGGGGYELKLSGSGKPINGSARVDRDKLFFTKDNISVVFEK
jgi:hypothetical protein